MLKLGLRLRNYIAQKAKLYLLTNRKSRKNRNLELLK